MSEEQNTTENVANLENLSPRELREQIQNLTLEVDLWKNQTKGARLERNDALGKLNGTLAELNALREATPQPALVRTLQQKIVNQRKQLKALQKAYDEQSKRVAAFETHCGQGHETSPKKRIKERKK